MIAYIRKKSGGCYASPVFAEIGKSFYLKSVVLNETGDGLILLPYAEIKKIDRVSSYIEKYNFFYIDGSLQDGWIKKRTIRGFAEIIKNKAIRKAMKRGEVVPTEGLEVMKLYPLPLPVITEFEINTKQDIDTFETVCWGLHDSLVDEIIKSDTDLIVNFDTTWEKHIILRFHNVIAASDLDNIDEVYYSTFEIESDCIKWKIESGYSTLRKDLKPGEIFVTAKRITWQLLID